MYIGMALLLSRSYVYHIFFRIAKFYWANSELIQKAIDTGMAARAAWERVPLAEKFDMWLKVRLYFLWFWCYVCI